jgi:formylglycine-generating enzyme required for sulfatase activity
MIRTFYGPVSFEIAKDWPLMASKIEIEAYAKSKGGRLPTEDELRVLCEHEEGPRPDGESANVAFKNWHPIP